MVNLGQFQFVFIAEVLDITGVVLVIQLPRYSGHFGPVLRVTLVVSFHCMYIYIFIYIYMGDFLYTTFWYFKLISDCESHRLLKQFTSQCLNYHILSYIYCHIYILSYIYIYIYIYFNHMCNMCIPVITFLR